MNRGNAYRLMGQLQQAIANYDEAIKFDPGSALAHANRALAYTILADDEAALQDVDRAAELGFDRSRLEADIEGLKSQR